MTKIGNPNQSKTKTHAPSPMLENYKKKIENNLITQRIEDLLIIINLLAARVEKLEKIIKEK
jgi:hypothetical protein